MKLQLTLTLLLFTLASFAQQDTIAPPYKRFPTVPPLEILLGDSTTIYKKEDLPKKPLLIVFFSPDCDHCQHEAKEIVAHKKEFSKVQIVMVTTYPIYKMNAFAEEYGLVKMKNVVMGRDVHYFFPSFFNIRNFPYLAMYDKQGNFLSKTEGTTNIQNIISVFKNAN